MKYITPKFIDLSYELISHSYDRIKESKFTLDLLSKTDQDLIYQNFYNSYMRSVGSSWDRYDFEVKADQWTFFGNVDGGIALRHQRSGMWKINSCYGSPKEILKGVQEMQSSIATDPIWGAMSENIAIMLEKATKRDGDKKFKIVPSMIAKHIVPHILNVFGGDVTANSDGTLNSKTPNGTTIKKVFIANKKYYESLLDMAQQNSSDFKAPQAVKSAVIGALKLFLKVW